MHWLLLCILFDFGFVQSFKFSQRRGYYAPVVVSTNYITLSIALTIYLVFNNALHFPTEVIGTGLTTGAVFISSMLLMNHALTIAPVGPVLTAFRMSIVIPVALGIWIWGEHMSITQFGGLILALSALALMTPRGEREKHTTGLKAFGLLAAICLWQGISHTCLRSVHYNGLDDFHLQILMLTGGTAGLIGCAVIAFKKRRPSYPELIMGIFIGLYNGVALIVIMTALSKLPGTLFFPVMGCSTVLLDNLFAHFYWKEPLSRPAIAGVGLAVFAIGLAI